MYDSKNIINEENNKNEELERLILEWKKLGYGKFPNIIEQMEWSIIETMLIEDFNLSYISTTGIEYPSLPNEVNKARKILSYAKKAKNLLKNFTIPKRNKHERLRSYQAKVANALEDYLLNLFTHSEAKLDSSIIADKYLCRCIAHPPLGYED